MRRWGIVAESAIVYMTKQRVEGENGQAGVEITPEMMAAGVAAFDAWAEKWNYFEGGVPFSGEVGALVSSVMRSMIAASPERSENSSSSV